MYGWYKLLCTRICATLDWKCHAPRKHRLFRRDKSKFHLARHVTTGHAILPQKKSRDVLRRACRAAHRHTRATTSVTSATHKSRQTSETGATRTTRVPGRRHSVHCDGRVHITFSESCSWDWCKSRAQKTKLVHASSSSSMMERKRRDTHNTSCVSCSDATSGIWVTMQLGAFYTNFKNCTICGFFPFSFRRTLFGAENRSFAVHTKLSSISSVKLHRRQKEKKRTKR